MERRDFMKAALGTAAGAAIGTTLTGPAFSGALALDSGHFQYGVAAGDPTARSAIIWTRVTPEPDATPGSGLGNPVTVSWVVAQDPHLRRVVRRGRRQTSAASDHTVKVDVRGLRPGRSYWYAFHSGEEQSTIGHFRTAPIGWDVESLSFGHVSCSNYAHGFFSPYRHLADRDDLDFVLHVGDYIYEYGDGTYGDFRPLDPSTEIVSLADYRRRFALYRADPDLQAVHAAHAFVTTIDDHEITNDAWADGAENHDDSEGDYAARKAIAMQVYAEWMPIRSRVIGGDQRIYRSLRWGGLADLTVLDLRQFRSQQVADWSMVNDSGRTMMGRRQSNWLEQQLRHPRSPQWRLIGNSVQFMPVRYLDGFFVSDGTGASRNTDAWDGYPASRKYIMNVLDEHRDDYDAVFLTGDIHSSWAADIPVDPDDLTSSSVATEFVCTSVTSDNLNEIVGDDLSPVLTQQVVDLNPHVKLLEFDSHGYSVVHVNPDRARSEWYFVSDREDAAATSTLGAAHETRYGSKAVS